MNAFELIGGILAVLGALTFLGGAIGLFRFPDAYMRASAVGTVSGVGISLVTLGAAIVYESWSVLGIALIAIVLQLITSSVATTMVGRAAVNSRQQFHPDTDIEALGHLPEIGDEDPVEHAEAADPVDAADPVEPGSSPTRP